MIQFAVSIAVRRALTITLLLAAVATSATAIELRANRPSLGDRMRHSHPTGRNAVGPGQRWAVACQARTDPDERLYLFCDDGDPDGTRIDDLETYSTDGRWVVVSTSGMMKLIDLEHDAAQLIPIADLQRRGRRPTIDRANQQLVYFHGEHSTTLAVRDLDTASEQTFDVGRDVEYFEIRDTPWIALRYRIPGRNDGAWDLRGTHPCRDTAHPLAPQEPDAWLDTTSGAIVETRPSLRP